MTDQAQPDYYEILQVSANAEPEIISAAYRRLSRMYHPDQNKSPDAQKRMTAINLAYEILNDPQKRAQYDLERKQQRAGDYFGGDTGAKQASPKQAFWALHSSLVMEIMENWKQRYYGGKAEVLLNAGPDTVPVLSSPKPTLPNIFCYGIDEVTSVWCEDSARAFCVGIYSRTLNHAAIHRYVQPEKLVDAFINCAAELKALRDQREEQRYNQATRPEYRPPPSGPSPRQPSISSPNWMWWLGGIVAISIALFFLFIGGGSEDGVVEATIGSTGEPTTTQVPDSTKTPRPTRTAKPTSTPIPTPLSLPVAQNVGDTWQRPTDGATVLYVPAGSFMMGDPEGKVGGSDAAPVHEVKLNGYWIDKTEVSNEQYAQCVTSKVCDRLEYGNYDHYEEFERPDYPALYVSWHDANNYCLWAGARLPTEAEWEYAARGPEERTFPWGESEPNCNVAQINGCRSGWSQRVGTVAVGSLPDSASWVGALNMAGNAAEWVQDWYDRESYTYHPDGFFVSPDIDSQSVNHSLTIPEDRVIRGGSWDDGSVTWQLGSYARDHDRPSQGDIDTGFRCAHDGTPTNSLSTD